MLSLKDYKSKTDGNVAMMFAFSSLMLLGGIGAAIDFTNMSREQASLQAQVDAGVLAAATVEIERTNNGSAFGNGNGNQERRIREEAAKEVIAANGYDLNQIAPVLTMNDESIVLTARLKYEPFFGGILGMNEIDLSASAESGLPGMMGSDIVLVLDNTNSMRVEGKLDALKTGAKALVDAIDESDSETKIGLVPFSRYVRVGEAERSATWLDVPDGYVTTRAGQQATHTGGTCTLQNVTRELDGVMETIEREVCVDQITTYEPVVNDLESVWEGCVGTRPPPYSERDDAYSHKIPGLLNRYAQEVTGLHFDRRTYCPSEIVALNTDYNDLKSELDRMYTTDETYLPMGLIWGQRVLSPGEPFDNAQSGDTPNKKVMVLMTDGLNTTEIQQDSSSQTHLHAPPFVGDVDDDEVATAANAATARVCASAKADGIEIYTIAFRVTDLTTQALLRNCASSPENALTADSNASLIATFEDIAESLEDNVRLWR